MTERTFLHRHTWRCSRSVRRADADSRVWSGDSVSVKPVCLCRCSLETTVRSTRVNMPEAQLGMHVRWWAGVNQSSELEQPLTVPPPLRQPALRAGTHSGIVVGGPAEGTTTVNIWASQDECPLIKIVFFPPFYLNWNVHKAASWTLSWILSLIYDRPPLRPQNSAVEQKTPGAGMSDKSRPFRCWMGFAFQ